MEVERKTGNDLWRWFWELFVASGKPLSPRDLKRTVGIWHRYDEETQKKIIRWCIEQFSTTWRTPQYTPMPYNALESEGWTREAAPRRIPDPNDPSVKLARHLEEQRRRGLR